MSQNEIVKVTTKQIKTQFLMFGVTMIIYGLIVLLSQYLVADMANYIHHFLPYINIDYIQLSIQVLIYGLGAFVPLAIFSKCHKISSKDYTRTTDLNVSSLMRYTCLILGINLLATFFFSLVASVFGKEMALMLPIGLDVSRYNFMNPLFLILVILVIPICEEYVFRGVSLRFLGRYGNRFAIIAVSVLFGLAHGSILDSFSAMIFSYCLCLITLRYKSVYPAMLIHICNNALFVIINLLISKQYLLVLGIILIIYVVAGYTFITNYKHRIVIRPEKDTNYLLKLFFSNVGVIAAILIFLSSSITLQLI